MNDFDAIDYLEAADIERKRRRENDLCISCGHPVAQHSYSMGCLARDEDGDCECDRSVYAAGLRPRGGPVENGEMNG